MSYFLVFSSVLVTWGLFLSSGSSLFLFLLFLDIVMFFILVSMASASGAYFILLMLLCVFSAAFGMTLLMSSMRKMGTDKLIVFW